MEKIPEYLKQEFLTRQPNQPTNNDGYKNQGTRRTHSEKKKNAWLGLKMTESKSGYSALVQKQVLDVEQLPYHDWFSAHHSMNHDIGTAYTS